MKKSLEISWLYTSVPKILIIGYTVHEIWHVTDIIVIFNLGLHFSLLPPKQPKKGKFQKNEKKKHLEISSFYTSVAKIMIIYYIVPEIWHMTDILGNFWPYNSPSPLLSPLPPPSFPSTVQKMKKIPRDIKVSSFKTSVPKIMIICFTVPEIWRVMDVIAIFHFGLFLHFYPRNSPKMKISKQWKKKSRRYHHFTQVHQKSWPYAILFLRSGTWHMQLLLFILGFFCTFTPLTAQFQKNEKTPGVIIILHMCTQNFD